MKTYTLEIAVVRRGYVVKGLIHKDYRGDTLWTEPSIAGHPDELGIVVDEILDAVDKAREAYDKAASDY